MKSAKKIPELTDEELMQVTGGKDQLWKSIYDKYVVDCPTATTYEDCIAMNVCAWSKNEKRCYIGDYEVVPDGTAS